MLTHKGRPLFATSEERRARRVMPWSQAIAMISTLSLLGWLAVVLSCEAIR